MSATETTAVTALQHIADGHDYICLDCGWTGDTPYEQYDSMNNGGAGGGLIANLCPVCRGDVESGADEIAAYALRQIETGGGE